MHGQQHIKIWKIIIGFWSNLLHPSSTLKVETAGCSESSVNFYQITQRLIPEDIIK